MVAGAVTAGALVAGAAVAGVVVAVAANALLAPPNTLTTVNTAAAFLVHFFMIESPLL
ncbi:hypothetical protein QOZ95_002941 [Paenibacillus brasilensis]|uniref:Uncharacterized protein n=1 Tax=Paenibacillus brasilensis TaxID=128574 RepID=A0ABU0KZP1_9BACL|nr:hypothetical protein [Paenibacillus brasilensis]